MAGENSADGVQHFHAACRVMENEAQAFPIPPPQKKRAHIEISRQGGVINSRYGNAK